METINYSLKEYFKNKYPDGRGGYCINVDENEEYNKFTSDLRNIFWEYNLHIFEDPPNHLGNKNSVQHSDEYYHYVLNPEEELLIEEDIWAERGFKNHDITIFDFKGFSNITPEIFLEDIKNILEKYSVKPTKAGELTKGLTSIESVFIKYIDIKTPIHLVQERQMRNNEIDKLNIELKQYKDLKELQSIKELIDKNKILMEENIKLVETEDVTKKVSEWLENNARHINFKIGKALLDIIT